MKKMLFAVSLAACAMPVQAITYVHYSAAGNGVGYVEDADNILETWTVFITLDFTRSLDSEYAQCTSDVVQCSNLQGHNIADLGLGYEGFWLDFDQINYPPPTTDDTFIGAIAYGYIALPDNKRFVYSTGFSSITINTFESDDTGLTTFDVTMTPLAAVPEPASWALMIGGFSLVGSTLRRRPRRTPQAVSCAA